MNPVRDRIKKSGDVSNGVKIITVSGAHSKVGKTTLIERLLASLKGWAAMKITVLHQGPCPTHRNCGACDGLDTQYAVIKAQELIRQEGKDTERYKKAGAKDVLWLKTKPAGLGQGIKDALSQLKRVKGVIIEGTSVLQYLKPDLAIMVKKEGSKLFKPSAQEALKKVDIVLNL